jgi:hypothetical protein
MQPASSPFADLFIWKSTPPAIALGATLTPTPLVAGQPLTVLDQLQFLGDSFFCLMGFMGSTNYDNYFPNYQLGGADNISQARFPNNFSVLITQNSDQKMMTNSMDQACICGSGYMEGHQLPYPMLLPPMTNIEFTYKMIAPFTLFSDAGHTDPIDLLINFGLYGYNVPTINLENFLASWPAMQRIAAKGSPMWLKNFTSMTIQGLTA